MNDRNSSSANNSPTNSRKKFRVTAISEDSFYADIWARDLNEAWDIAFTLDAGLYRLDPKSAYWEINDIESADSATDFDPVG